MKVKQTNERIWIKHKYTNTSVIIRYSSEKKKRNFKDTYSQSSKRNKHVAPPALQDHINIFASPDPKLPDGSLSPESQQNQESNENQELDFSPILEDFSFGTYTDFSDFTNGEFDFFDMK